MRNGNHTKNQILDSEGQLSFKTMQKRLLLALFTLLCVCEAIDGRKELSSYWRSVMKGEDMPDAIKGLVLEDGQPTGFDMEIQARPNLIIYNPDQYHHHDEHAKAQEVKGLKLKDNKKTEDMV